MASVSFPEEEMKGSGVELSDTVYSAVLKVLGNKGDYPTAKRQGKIKKELGDKSTQDLG